MKRVAFIIVAGIALGLGSIAAVRSDTRKQALPFYTDNTLTPRFLSDTRDIASAHRVGDFDLADQRGEHVSRSTTRNHVYVASFFYTTCQSLCPSLRTQLARVHETFRGDSGVLILSHTVMPEHDDVGKLSHYAWVNGIDHAQWRLLTGDRSTIERLARDSYFVELSDSTGNTRGRLRHTETLVLVDGDSHIRGVYDGSLPFEVSQLIADIRTIRQSND